MGVKIIRDVSNRKKIEDNLVLLKGTQINAGITKRVAQITNDKSDEKLVTYAYANEMGIGVPERSFLRSTFDENEKTWFNTISNDIDLTVPYSKNKTTLKKVGKNMEKDVKTKIKTSVPPKNSPETLKQKQGNTTLIDTGLMLNNIEYEVIQK